MYSDLNMLVSVFFIVDMVNSAWVEIPQASNKKSFLGVTPYSPYIYEKSSVFTFAPTSTTPAYDTIATPMRDHSFADKKSITKLPDSIMKNFLLTTQMPSYKKFTTTPMPRNTTSKPNKVKNKNVTKPSRMKSTPRKLSKNVTKTTTSTTTHVPRFQPKVSKVILDEHAYDEHIYSDDEEYDEDDLDEERPMDKADEEYYDDTEYEEEAAESEKGNGEYSYAGFLPYLQTIQSTLIRSSHKNVQGKVSFLTEIKNRLLYAIKEKIASIWSPKTRKARSTRGDYSASWEKGDSSMQFPSNEGALLTLSFLTFAVFLIKCVLALVHAMKSKEKHPIFVIPWTTTTTTTPAPMMRLKRSMEEESLEVMNLIETYKYI